MAYGPRPKGEVMGAVDHVQRIDLHETERPDQVCNLVRGGRGRSRIRHRQALGVQGE